MYRNDGFEVTVCDQQAGPQILRVPNTTTAGTHHLSVRIVTDVQKPGVMLTEVEELLAAGPDVHLVVDSVEAATRLSGDSSDPDPGNLWHGLRLLQSLTTARAGQIQDGLRRTDAVACHGQESTGHGRSDRLTPHRGDQRPEKTSRFASRIARRSGLPRYEPQDDSHVVIKREQPSTHSRHDRNSKMYIGPYNCPSSRLSATVRHRRHHQNN